MLDASGRIQQKSTWAFTAIERLFDAVREALALRRNDYDIVGFSGGGQFVHRLVLFLPEARFHRAVAASPGRYVFPSWSSGFRTASTGARSTARASRRRFRAISP
jgi:hypothetical protein